MSMSELTSMLAQAKKIAAIAQANGCSASRLARLFHYEPQLCGVDEMTWSGEVALMLLRDGWGEDFVRSAILHDAYRGRGGTWGFEDWDMMGQPTDPHPIEAKS